MLQAHMPIEFTRIQLSVETVSPHAWLESFDVTSENMREQKTGPYISNYRLVHSNVLCTIHDAPFSFSTLLHLHL
uniref:Uncharacterized protein n=1 Tax=Aegilops tauschii subsp. strangulata TaxID=200361 RepID=A0A453I0N1_AEGTS